MYRPSRGARESATTTRYDGSFFLPVRVRRIVTAISSPPESVFPIYDITVLPGAPSRKYLGIRAPLHPLPLRCTSSPYSTVCLSRAPCWRGASTLSVLQAIYETVH